LNTDLQNEYESTLNGFFKLANKENYSIEKYYEIVDLNSDWGVLKEHIQTEEFQQYKKIIQSTKPENTLVENYINQFPDSKYINELQNDLRKKTNAILSPEEQRQNMKNEFEKAANIPARMTCGQLNKYIAQLNDLLIFYPNSELSSSIELKLNESNKRKEQFWLNGQN
jgi:hypothetical protein